jgi:hypothetical protein
MTIARPAVRRSGAPRGLKRVFLHTADLLDGAWLALPASLRGFEIQLQAYCAAQENGGRITRAKRWGTSQWLMTLGRGGNAKVVAALASAGLVEWDGDDLIVFRYDRDAEEGYQKRRENGRAGGIEAAKRRAQQTEGRDEPSEPPSNTTADTATNTTGRAEEESRVPLGGGGSGEEKAVKALPPPRARSSGTGTGGVRPSGPISVRVHFESTHLAAFSQNYETGKDENAKLEQLWTGIGSADRACLFADVDEYIARRSGEDDHEASLTDFCAWWRDTHRRPSTGRSVFEATR